MMDKIYGSARRSLPASSFASGIKPSGSPLYKPLPLPENVPEMRNRSPSPTFNARHTLDFSKIRERSPQPPVVRGMNTDQIVQEQQSNWTAWNEVSFQIFSKRNEKKKNQKKKSKNSEKGNSSFGIQKFVIIFFVLKLFFLSLQAKGKSHLDRLRMAQQTFRKIENRMEDAGNTIREVSGHMTARGQMTARGLMSARGTISQTPRVASRADL